MRTLLAVPLRLLAFVGKELVETIRRPGAIVSLILGPFLIMLVFGLGFSGTRRPLETVVVVPSANDQQLPTDPGTYQQLAGGGLHIAGVTSDQAAAEAQLQAGQLDVVIIVPDDAEAQFRAGKQSTIQVQVNAVDPVQVNYAGFLASLLSSAVNREIITRVATEGQGYAVAAGEAEAAQIPPEVVAAPTTSEVVNLAPSQPGVIAFFAPAVLALILQHLAVTLIALSLVRERTSGVIELFRISPVSTWEVLLGKVLAFGLLGGGIAAITLGLMVAGLGVPFLGPPALVIATIGLLLLASLGLGLLVAVVSDSERQAVPPSLLVLLASVFFSGFVLAIEEFSPVVHALTFLLPVTHGIRLLQDILLRGSTTNGWEFAALAAIALVTLIASWALLRRSMTRA